MNQELLSKTDKFDCGHSDLNDFFANDCVDYTTQLLGKSYCFILNENERKIVCAFTLANDSIKTQFIPPAKKNKINRNIPNVKRMKSYPSVLIGRLGVNVDYRRRKVGDDLMSFIKAWFIDEKNKTGCRYVVVDSYNESEPLYYYNKNKFKFLFDEIEEEKQYLGLSGIEDDIKTRLMIYDLILLKPKS